ncbi:MAG TPA: transcriptional antiterminator [Erysipelotrichaceae bacterium]|nr:transcriptional antiterminator [Erysipelotrichaceae bacterium]
MAKEKEDRMLNYLIKNPGWHSVDELAIYVGVSKRTIKNYYKNLSIDNKIESSNKGYHFIDGAKKINEDYEDTKKGRLFLFLNKLISNGSYNIFDLSQDMYLSESTLKEIGKLAAEYTKRFDVNIYLKGDDFIIEGEEINKRHILSDMIYKESEGSFISQSTLNAYFPAMNTDDIFTIVEVCARNHDIYINTFDLSNIVLHISIAIERISDDSKIEQIVNVKEGASLFATDVLSSVEQEMQVQFSENEKNFLSLIIDAAISRWNSKTLLEKVPASVQSLLNDIENYIFHTYRVNLKKNNFSDQLAIHVTRLIQRLEEGTVVHNPMLNDMKISSPTIYECAVLVADRVGEYVHKPVPDSEIAYIAMHIGNAIAEQIAENKRITTVVLAPNYQNSLMETIDRINKTFSELTIVKTVSDEKDIPDNVDFIISIGKIIQSDIPNINISIFLTSNDIKKINLKIQDVRTLKETNVFDQNLYDFFDKRFFEINNNYNNRDEVIDHIFETFYDNGVVKQEYRNALFDREKMSSTAFGNIAIPHSIKMNAIKTKAFVLINQKGIWWDDKNKVNIVIALAVMKDDVKMFRDIFDKVSDVMIDAQHVAELVSCKTYEEFFNKLRSMI